MEPRTMPPKPKKTIFWLVSFMKEQPRLSLSSPFPFSMLKTKNTSSLKAPLIFVFWIYSTELPCISLIGPFFTNYLEVEYNRFSTRIWSGFGTGFKFLSPPPSVYGWFHRVNWTDIGNWQLHRRFSRFGHYLRREMLINMFSTVVL